MTSDYCRRSQLLEPAFQFPLSSDFVDRIGSQTMDSNEETAMDSDMVMESTDGEESSATTASHPQSNEGRVCDEIHDESVAMTTSPTRQETGDDAMATSPVCQEMGVAISTCLANQETDVVMTIRSTSRVPEAVDHRADENKVLLVPSESDADMGGENSKIVCSIQIMNNDRQVPDGKINECSVTTASTSRAPDTATHQARIAQRTWEMHNDVKLVRNIDDVYKYDADGQQNILNAKPWGHDPHFFKNIKISALALLKMVMHARSGGNLEIMGLLLGKVDGNTMIVMDAFALPVEGTETRVSAQTEAYEYMSTYMNSAKEVGRLENAIGWYHSHPGYGCWLSGIDVSTQMLNQQFQEPFVAIVIDPIRTISAGKVCIGGFRTYPKEYKPPNDNEGSQYQTIPLSKIEDFGVHSKQYYSLEISYFKSSLDCRLLESLWNKYWVNTLSSSSLLTNTDYLTSQIDDLSEKLEQSHSQVHRVAWKRLESEEVDSEDKLAKATKDCTKTTIEMLRGSMTQCLKHILFNKEN